VEKPPRPSQHAAAAKVVPAASPSAGHLPVAPLDAPTQQRIPDPAPTDPRNDVTTEDIVIPILAEEIALPIDEAPPSSGEVAVEPGDRPTRPAVLRVPEPKLVPAQPRTPAVAGPVAVPGSTTVHTAVTPMASAVVPSAVAPAVVQPVTDVPTPIVPPVSTLSAAATPAAVPPQPVTTPQAVSASAAPSPRRLSAVPTAPGSQPQVSIKDLPPMRALAPTEPEGLEVSFEDEEPAPETPSEPEAEIAAEDLVSVESAPHPSTPLAASVRAVPQTQTETPMRGFMPVGVPASGPASRVSVPPPPSVAKPPPSGGQKGAPRVIVPSGGALAPPPMGDAPTGRRKARPWWEELFNDDFIRTMAKISDAQIAKEVDFIEESLAVAKGAMLLDLGCGTGRHAIELTRRGYKVVGFDLSLPMLAKAAEEAQERSQKLNFVQGDMREMTFEDTFDGIYCWNTSFGFFEEDKNAQVVQRVHKALKKGGQFMLEVGNRDFMIRQAPSLAWFEGDGCICMDEMSIDWITSRMKVKRTMMMDDGRTKEIDYSVRIYSLHELGKVLHDAGFRVVEVSGRTGTPGVYFGNESPRTMILAEKK
jgi:SAM-dependent methyltransferase